MPSHFQQGENIIYSYMRPLVYALVSLFSIITGYIYAGGYANLRKYIFLILFVWAISIVYFIVFTLKYEYSQFVDQRKREVVITGLVLASLFAVVFFLFNAILGDIYLFRQFWAQIILYLSLYFLCTLYSLFVLDNKGRDLVRNQLILPSLLTIAFSMYFGYSLTNYSIAPFIVLYVYFFTSFLWTIAYQKNDSLRQKIAYLVTSILFVFGVMLFVDEFAKPETFANLNNLLFFVLFSAYMAIFESWKLSSKKALVCSENIVLLEGQMQNLSEISKVKKDYETYIKYITLIIYFILTIMPFLYYFNDAYHSVFFYFFFGWSSFVFYKWFSKYKKMDFAKSKLLLRRKVLYGIITLVAVSIAFSFSKDYDLPFSFERLFNPIITLVISIIGLVVSFFASGGKINKGSSYKEFFLRFIYKSNQDDIMLWYGAVIFLAAFCIVSMFKPATTQQLAKLTDIYLYYFCYSVALGAYALFSTPKMQQIVGESV